MRLLSPRKFIHHQKQSEQSLETRHKDCASDKFSTNVSENPKSASSASLLYFCGTFDDVFSASWDMKKDQILLVIPITFQIFMLFFLGAKTKKKAEVSRDVKKVTNFSFVGAMPMTS
jgi:hypothetical protein